MAVIQRVGTRENTRENKRKCGQKVNAMLHNHVLQLVSEAESLGSDILRRNTWAGKHCPVTVAPVLLMETVLY